MPPRPKRENESSSKSSTDASQPDFLAVARITKPHGTRGELVLASLSGETDHLLRIGTLRLRPPGMSGADSGPDKVVEVETIRRAHNRVIVKLQGFDTPETAASLRGMEVWVSRQQAAPLAESEYYVADLVGCRAFLWTEEPPIGEVLGVIEGPTDDFLEIGLVGGGSALVPLRDDYVGTVDTAAKRIEILDPDILK